MGIMNKARKIILGDDMGTVDKVVDVTFKFNLGDKAKDKITGFKGLVVRRTQWLNNCNTYGLQSIELKDGVPQDPQSFDEPQISLVEEKAVEVNNSTGGPNRLVSKTTNL